MEFSGQGFGNMDMKERGTLKKAYLLLADGTLFEGKSCGYEGQCTGEVVFNTSMAGYQEILTDPSYYGQIVTMTYPLIGNFGINLEVGEPRKSWVSGFIMREECMEPSNFLCRGTLDDYLKEQKVIGLCGIDTRQLTRKIRTEGVMNGIIYTEGFAPDTAAIAALGDYKICGSVKETAPTETKVYPAKGDKRFRVAMLNYGCTYGIEEALQERGCEVTMLPGLIDAKTVLEGGYDGIMLMNGPGDPAESTELVQTVKELLDSDKAVFGICLGYQLMSLAMGAKTEKLKFGHHGANQPVKDLDSDRTYITNQNRGYTVTRESIKGSALRVRFINLNDDTVEGVQHLTRPIFGVQFCPEISSGPTDASFLLDQFVKNMEKTKGGAQ